MNSGKGLRHFLAGVRPEMEPEVIPHFDRLAGADRDVVHHQRDRVRIVLLKDDHAIDVELEHLTQGELFLRKDRDEREFDIEQRREIGVFLEQAAER